jgi:structural maintenance of chromosome 2
MINGATAQQQNVQNLFQSVGLNVNNPHFLIMQGRITKVLNMKPKEILGLIEEAAGTRMFEVKKEQAVKTIEKKQEKVDQITRVLDEEITPTLKKLQEERANYLKWAANNTECERLSRLCIAWDYTQADKLRTGSAEAVAKLQADVSAAIKGATAFRTAAEAKSKEITAADAKLASARSGEHSALASTVDGLSKDVSRAEGAHKVKSAELAVEEKGRDNAIKAAKDGETQRATLAATQAKQRADAGVAKEEADRLGKTASSLQAKLTAVRAGMTGEGEGTVAEQLMAAKAAVTKLGGAANKADMTAKAEAAKIKDLQAAVKSAEGQSGALTQALQLGAQKLEKHRAELAALNFDARKHDALKTQREALAAEVFKAADEQERATEGLGASFGFSYDKKAMGTSWDERRVRGTVASLIRVKPAHMGAAEALGVVAGGKLTHVVVDSDETGKMLLEKGKSRRVTLVPLNTIRSRAPTPAQVAAAASLGPGRAVLASSCVSADAAYNKVLEYVFGAAFICDSDETAKRVAFGDGMRCLAVTLAGDVFDPAGTLEGGAPQSAGKGGVPIMVRVGQVNELGDRLASSKAELAALDVILVSMTKAAAVYTEKEEQVTRMEHSQGLLQQTLAGSSLGEAQRNLELATKKVETETATSAAAKVALKEAAAKVEALSAEMKNAEKIREQRVKAVEGELEKASKEAGVAETKAKALIKAAEQSGYDLEALTKSTGVEAALIAERSAAVAALVKEVAVLSAALAAVRAKYEAAKAKLEAAQEAIAAADKARTKLFKEREADLSAADDEDRKTRALEGEVKKTQSAGAAAEKGVSDLLVRYPWIASERANFGMQFSDYDFKTADPKAAQTKLNGLAKQQADLEKRINKKVMGMIESAEREYAELRGKKSIIENDKDKINVRGCCWETAPFVPP